MIDTLIDMIPTLSFSIPLENQMFVPWIIGAAIVGTMYIVWAENRIANKDQEAKK